MMVSHGMNEPILQMRRPSFRGDGLPKVTGLVNGGAGIQPSLAYHSLFWELRFLPVGKWSYMMKKTFTILSREEQTMVRSPSPFPPKQNKQDALISISSNVTRGYFIVLWFIWSLCPVPFFLCVCLTYLLCNFVSFPFQLLLCYNYVSMLLLHFCKHFNGCIIFCLQISHNSFFIFPWVDI